MVRLRHRYQHGETRRYTVELFLSLADVRSRATLLSVDKISAQGATAWTVERRTRVFRRPDLLMDQLLPDMLNLTGAPGPNRDLLYTPLGPSDDFRFPAEAIGPGQRWASHGDIDLTYETPRKKDPADLIRLGLGRSKTQGGLQGQLIFSAEQGVLLGVQALTFWTDPGGTSGQILVQSRLRERLFADGTKAHGPSAKALGF